MTLRIYLGDEYSLFKNGVVIYDDGSEVELQNYIHRGMMVDIKRKSFISEVKTKARNEERFAEKL
ncbi:MAG: hypothetical protein IKJ91_10105 [Clostridia bacterium]|nr:hypothetical protein [Clostridia bacterium]